MTTGGRTISAGLYRLAARQSRRPLIELELREELILDPKRLDAVQKVRRVFATDENFYKATERLVERIEATKDNEAFINSLPGMR